MYINKVEVQELEHEYQYAISDHQGNTRVVFSSETPEADDPVATFEGNSGDESTAYQNVNPAAVVSSIAANHTTSGSKAIRMDQNYRVGPSKSVKVYPGDKIDMEVWEYHEASSGFGSGSGSSTLINIIAGAFGGVSGAAGESGVIYSGVNEAGTLMGLAGNRGTNAPAAYLNYILFDEEYKPLDMGYEPVPATTMTRQKVTIPTINIKEEGYIFVYLSYDNDGTNFVFFDDFKVTHTKTNVVQYNDYYPYGLQTRSSWTREDNRNDYLYNAGSELNETSGWYETFFRSYDPAIGRFTSMDPLAAKYGGLTPYNFGFSNPVRYNDPIGAEPPDDGTVSGDWSECGCFPNFTGAKFFGGDNAPTYGMTTLDVLWQDATDPYGYNTNANRKGRVFNPWWGWMDLDDPEAKIFLRNKGHDRRVVIEFAHSDPNLDVLEKIRHFGALLLGLEGPTEEERERTARGILDGSIPLRVTGTVDVSPVGKSIAAYATLAKLTKGWKGAIQAHHILEVRHLKTLGLSIREAPSIILSRAKHLEITKTLQSLLPTGSVYTKAEIMAAYQKAYKAYPEWIQAASKYLGL